MTGIFDFVIVGGGSAGSILAGRLAETPGISICVLEAGRSDNTPLVQIPAGFLKVAFSPNYTWGYQSDPVPALHNRPVPMIQGRVLGGGSSVNGMLFVRGQAGDFDHWAQRGNPGWSYADVLPYFRAYESRRTGDPEYRGATGPISVIDPDWPDKLTDAFIESTTRLGVPRNPDYNGARQEGVGRYQFNMGIGHRMGPARGFLRPAARAGRVDLRLHARTTRLLLEGRRVVGLRYRRAGSSEEIELRARRAVILSAGAINTPRLLQISGIGPGALLNGLGIPVLHDLPGVGENLHDHYVSRMVYEVRGVQTVNDLVRGPRLAKQMLNWALGRPSLLSIGPVLGNVFWKSREGLDEADYVITFTPGSYRAGRMGEVDTTPGLTIGAYQLRPESRGHVRARSADPDIAPEIQPNFLALDSDRRVLIEAMKFCRRIAATDPLAAYCAREVYPGPGEAMDDAGMEEFIRNNGQSGYHPVGTCRMGPASDPMAVVDARLAVHGLDGLHIADASIMPSITSGNTNAPSMMIGAKAADLLLGR